MNRPERRRKSDPKPADRVGPIILVVALSFIAVVLLVFGGRLAGVVNDNEQQIQQAHASDLSACASGNESRLSNIKNYEADIRTLQGDISFLRLTGPSSPHPQAALDLIAKKESSITLKENTIEDQIAAVSEFAAAPGSPIKDCDKAYPAPN